MRAMLVLVVIAAVVGCNSDPPPTPQGKPLDDRTRQWIRGGTKELGSDTVPAYVPGKGFGPDSLPNPALRSRQQ